MTSNSSRKFFDPNIPRKGATLVSHINENADNQTMPPFFSIIEFNLSGLCNRTCVFCPRSDPKIFPNVNQHIPMELYEKIVKELGEIQYDGMILYSAFGEPLLYKNIEEIIKLTKVYCPNVKIESVTDGDFVTVDKLTKLFAAGLDTLLISMYDGPHQDEHFRSLSTAAGLDESQVILRKRWLPPEEHYGITLSNRSGMIQIPEIGVGALDEPLKRPCYYPFYQLLIDYDGSVLICPHDWGKKLVVGNLNTGSLMDIWNNSPMRRIRQRLGASDRNFAPCNKCDVDGTYMGGEHFERWKTYYQKFDG